MLSSDSIEPRGGRTPTDHTREPVQSYNLDEPWDAEAAEALTRLYETDEGMLCQPDADKRADVARVHEPARGGKADADDRAWLEARLSELGGRLQDTLARLDPEKPLATLCGRLEALEQRFGSALGRVAQRADMDALRSIEAQVLELAAHLEQSRERLEQIGTVEEQVRRLAQRLDEGDMQRLDTLGKLLRDYIVEWRESEQRTAGALQSLEEAIGRLGESVDAMEAVRPAPDLSLPTLSGAEPSRVASNPFARAHAEGDSGSAPRSYHARLEAADYAPRLVPDLPRSASEPPDTGQELHALPTPAIEWSAKPDGADHGRPASMVPARRGFRIMAVRAKLRRIRVATDDAGNEQIERPPATEDDPHRPATRPTRFGLLLIAGVTFLAGGAYLLFQTLVAVVPPAASPTRIKPSAEAPAAKPLAPAGWVIDRSEPDSRRLE